MNGEPVQEKLQGLGGWLILFGIMLFAMLIVQAVNIDELRSIFFTDVWAVLTTPGAAGYHPFWAPLLVGSAILNLSLFAACCWLIILFFLKKNILPTAFIVIALSFPVYVVVESALITIITGEAIFDAETVKEVNNSFSATVIWIVYLLRSKRVKATFGPISWLEALKLKAEAKAKAKAEAKAKAKE